MSRTDKVVKGISASYIFTIVRNVFHFFITPYFLSVLEPALWGLNSFLTELFGYTTLSESDRGILIESVLKDT
ncbi:hypothetical protein K9N50_05735 [bacterium]|nr:hypothetical protein [bacterium]